MAADDGGVLVIEPGTEVRSIGDRLLGWVTKPILIGENLPMPDRDCFDFSPSPELAESVEGDVMPRQIVFWLQIKYASEMGRILPINSAD